ncbi:MAG: hypothetical protein D6710_04330, partial [Nitrospirae bacterium]
MKINELVKEAFAVLKKNTILIAPSIIATLITSILGVSLTGMRFNEHMYGRFMLVGLVGFILHALSVCIILSMAMDSLGGSQPLFSRALKKSLSRFFDILIATLIISLLAALGAMFFIIPSLLVFCVFMFTYVAIMEEGLSALDALKESYRTVRANLSATVTLFIILLGIALSVQLIEIFFAMFRF